MKTFHLFAVLVTLPLLFGGCNQSSSVFKYEIHGDNVTITDCEVGTSGELVIPDTIKGKPVTTIGIGAFDFCISLIAVTFLGDAPKAGERVFSSATPTIYRKPEAKGWGDTFGGRPVKLISEKP